MRRKGLILVLVIGSGVAVACSSFGSASDGDGDDAGTEGASPADGEAPVDDASGARDGGGGGTDSGDIFDDDFESDESSCVGWHGNLAQLELATDAGHGGSHSCHVCLQSTSNTAIALNSPIPLPGPGDYEFDFYFLLDPQDAGDQQGMTGKLTTLDDAGNGTNILGSNYPAAQGTWLLVQTSGSASASQVAATLGAYLGVQESGFCFYIDDVKFFRQH